MPISERDIFESLMKDPNHAYNPIGKVWQEAQQRARQFRNNEKALALAFDKSPLEKLFDFVQKADDDAYGNLDEFRGRVQKSWLTNRKALRKLKNTMNKYGQSYGGDFGWKENLRNSVQPIEEISYRPSANADTITDNIYSIGEDYERNGPILEHLLTLGKDGIEEGMENILQHFFTPNGQIKPELLAKAKAMTENKHLNDTLYPYTMEQRQAATDAQRDFEEGSGAARGEGPSDEERDRLFGGGPLGTGMIAEDNDASEAQAEMEYIERQERERRIAEGRPPTPGSSDEENAWDEYTDSLNLSDEIKANLETAQDQWYEQPMNRLASHVPPSDMIRMLRNLGVEVRDNWWEEASSSDTEDYYPPFTLKTLNELQDTHKRDNQLLESKTKDGWDTNIKLTSPQFRTLRGLGIVSGDSYKEYNWTAEGDSVRQLLTYGNRTKTSKNVYQPLNPPVFDALVHAITNDYLVGHIPESTIEEERNQQTTSGGAEDGEGQPITGERESVNTNNINNMSPEGWEDYMREYPHKEVGYYPEGEAEGPLGDIPSLLLPREMGSWNEAGEFTEGDSINPFINAEGVHLQDMKDEEGNLSPEGKAHVRDMFRKLIDIFHAGHNKNNPDSIPNRFGQYDQKNRLYYNIDVTADGFPKDAYNSHLENHGVLEKYLLKFGELLGINTDRQVQSLVDDQDTGVRIQNHERRVPDKRTGEPTKQPINPATGEPYPYTAADIDSFIEENNFPDELKTLTWGDTRNSELPQDHPAYRGGIYSPNYTLGDDIYIHEGAWEWADVLYSLGLVDPDSGYPAFHMLSRMEYNRRGGHGLDFTKIWNGANTIQKLLNVRNMEIPEGETETSFVDNAFKMFHEKDKAEFIEKHPGARDGSYAEAWNDYQRFLGNPTAESEAARVLPDTDLSEEEQDIAARRASMPDFHTWVENYLNGDYENALGALWPEDVLEDGVGPNGQRRMHLYKEDDATQNNHNKPILSKADRMEKWLFSADSLNSQRNLEGGQGQSETGGERVVIGTNEGEEQTTENEQGTTDDTEDTTSEVIPPAGGAQGEFGFDTLPARDADYIWVWQADENNPLEGSWVWTKPTEADTALLETGLAHAGWEDGEKIPAPPTPPSSIIERNEMIHDILEQEFGGSDYDMNDREVIAELNLLLRHHSEGILTNDHDKLVIQPRRKAREAERKEANKPPKPEAEIKPNDKPLETDELERMVDAFKTAVENVHQQPMSKVNENWLRSLAVNDPARFRRDYGAAIERNEKYVADEAKKQRERDANDIEGYRGILPLQQMPTEDDVKTQIRRLEYWKNKHGQHMSDKTQGIWNQRWQEISQAAANIPGFDMDEFIAADKAQAEEANMEYGGEDHLKAAGKAQVKEMYGDAAYMKAVGEGASLRANRNYKPWLVVKYDSNGAGTLHDLRQKDDVTGEWGKQIDPNSLTFDEDQHYFDYNETKSTQPQQSAAERFWSKLDRYANFRPIDHQGALERFDNDDNKFARTKSLLGEHGVQHGWFHPESGAWINPHRYNDVREELANAGPGSGMVIPAGEHYHGSHRPEGQGEANPRYAFARRGKAKVAQMNNNNDLSYYVDSQGNISHADGEWPAVQQKDKTQPQAVNDVIHDYYSQQFYNYFTQSGNSFKDNEGNFLTGKVLRPPSAPQQPMQQMDILKEVFRGDALERRRRQRGEAGKAQPGSKDLMSDELGHSGEFWGTNQEYQQRYRDVFDKTGSGILGWLSGIVNPFAMAADVKDSPSTIRGVGRGAKGVVRRFFGKNDPAYEAIRRIRRQYRMDAEAEQRTKDVMDKLQMHGNPMRYLSPGEAKARGEDLAELRRHVSKKVAFHQQEAKKVGVNDPQHQYHNDQNLEFQGVNSQLNNLNSDLDSDWQHINRLYDDYMGNQQVQDKFAPSSEEGWANRFENPQQSYQPSQVGQQPSGGLSGLIADDSVQRSPLQGLIGNDSGESQQSPLQGLIA